MADATERTQRTVDDRVELVRHALDMSYQYVIRDWNGNGGYFQQAQRAAMAYERVMDPNAWQTMSEIYFPFAKIAVDMMLPTVMWSVFQEDDMFMLVPLDQQRMDFAQARRVTDYIHYELMTVMNLWLKAYATVKDAIKLGCGYGLIDIEYITPWKWQTRQVNGVPMGIEALNMGEPRYQPRYRGIRFGRILPSPGGGPRPEERDWVIFVDHVPELELKMMLEDDRCPVTGDFGAITKKTRDNNLDGRIASLTTLLGALTKENATFEAPQIQNLNLSTVAGKLPCLVPVIKWYSRNRHIWLANGDTVIYDMEDTAQALHCPIVKATIQPEADDWYVDGLISANEDMFTCNNIIANTILDMIDHIARPRFVKNNQLIPHDMNLAPWGVTDAFGDVRTALQPLEMGRLAPEVMAMFDRLQAICGRAHGHTPEMEAASPGMVRGGAGALESMMMNSTARDKLAANVLDMGFVKEIVENVLWIEQLTIGDEQRPYQIRQAPNSKRGDAGDRLSWYDNKVMTAKDLRNQFRTSILLREKLRNGLADANMRAQLVQVINQDPSMARLVAPDAKLEYLLSDRGVYQRFTAGADPSAWDQVMREFAEFSRPGRNAAGAGGMSGAGGSGNQQARLGGLPQ